ncbi:MAG: hypothetical protein IJU19_05955 [Bacteroidales bacterium]|nr:hypothetical protein [Bacteroidales bacterium]
MKDYWAQHGSEVSNPQMTRLMVGLDMSVFAVEKLSFNIRIAGCEGTGLSGKKATTVGLLAVGQLEYYFPLGEKSQLSIGAGFGADAFGYFHDDAAARYDNLIVPLTATWWHRRIGIVLTYEWCVGKNAPSHNGSGLPKLAPNYISAGVRFR